MKKAFKSILGGKKEKDDKKQAQSTPDKSSQSAAEGWRDPHPYSPQGPILPASDQHFSHVARGFVPPAATTSQPGPPMPRFQSPYASDGYSSQLVPPVPHFQSPYSSHSYSTQPVPPVPNFQSPYSSVGYSTQPVSSTPHFQSSYSSVGYSTHPVPPAPHFQSPYSSAGYSAQPISSTPQFQSPYSSVGYSTQPLSSTAHFQSPYSSPSYSAQPVSSIPHPQSQYSSHGYSMAQPRPSYVSQGGPTISKPIAPASLTPTSVASSMAKLTPAAGITPSVAKSIFPADAGPATVTYNAPAFIIPPAAKPNTPATINPAVAKPNTTASINPAVAKPNDTASINPAVAKPNTPAKFNPPAAKPIPPIGMAPATSKPKAVVRLRSTSPMKRRSSPPAATTSTLATPTLPTHPASTTSARRPKLSKDRRRESSAKITSAIPPSLPATIAGRSNLSTQHKQLESEPARARSPSPHPIQNHKRKSVKEKDGASDSDSDVDMEDLIELMLASRNRTGALDGDETDVRGPMEALILAALLSKANGSEKDEKTSHGKPATSERSNPATTSRASASPSAIGSGPSSTSNTPGIETSKSKKSMWPPPASTPKFKVPIIAKQPTETPATPKTANKKQSPMPKSQNDTPLQLQERQEVLSSPQTSNNSSLSTQGATEPSKARTTSSTTPTPGNSTYVIGKTTQSDEDRDSLPTPQSIAQARDLHEQRTARLVAAAAATRSQGSARNPAPVGFKSGAPEAAKPRITGSGTPASGNLARAAQPDEEQESRLYEQRKARISANLRRQRILQNPGSEEITSQGLTDDSPVSSQVLPRTSITSKQTEKPKLSTGPKFKVPVLSEDEKRASATSP